MKRRLIYAAIPVLFVTLCIPTISYIFREQVEVYHFDISVLTGSYILDVFLSWNTYATFFDFGLVDPPNAIGWGAIIFVILFRLLRLASGIKDKHKYDQKEEYGSHGSARWQTASEIKEHYYRSKDGWLLGDTRAETYKLGGDFAYHPVDNSGGLNMQINVMGPPGSKKTTGFILGNLFHIPHQTRGEADIICTDPKSELFMYSASYLKKIGYDVHVLDFIHLKHGDALNPLDFITEDKELMEIADGYVRSSSIKVDVKTGDPIWDDGETLLLAALIGFVKQVYPLELQTFNTVANILSSENIRNHELAEKFFEKNNVTGTTLSLYKKFLMLEDKLRSGVLGGLAIKLTPFSIAGIQYLTGKSTFDIRKIGAKKDKPMAVFICIPDEDMTFAPIINTIVSMMFNQMYKTARIYGNRLHTPVYVLLDEMANIGRISGLKEKLSTMRGRRIYPMMIWQSLPQMKDRYKESWEEILSMCDTQIYLGVNDQTTAEYLSKSLGNTTIKVQSRSRSKKEGHFFDGSESESFSHQKRELLTPDECRRFDRDKLILVQGGRHPAILKKVQYRYWDHKHRICDELPLFSLPLLEELYTTPSGKNEESNETQILNELEKERTENPTEEVKVEDTILSIHNLEGEMKREEETQLPNYKLDAAIEEGLLLGYDYIKADEESEEESMSAEESQLSDESQLPYNNLDANIDFIFSDSESDRVYDR